MPSRWPARDADVEGLAGAYDVDEGLQGLVERRGGVVAVRVEEVDVVQLHAAEALVEAGHEALARAPVAVGAGPHLVARLGRDEQLVAVGAQRVVEDAAERLLGAARRRAVVVGQVEVGHAVVEGVVHEGAARGVGRRVAEVFPQSEREGGQQDAALPRAAVGHGAVVAAGGGEVVGGGHGVRA